MGITNETWSYERKQRRDRNGVRWHFVSHDVVDPRLPYEERPFELYFRNDNRTEFGVLRFERRKDNPYRDYDACVTKILNDSEFRQTLLNPDTASVWKQLEMRQCPTAP